MCSGPEAGSYLRLIDFVYLSTINPSPYTRAGRQGRHQGGHCVCSARGGFLLQGEVLVRIHFIIVMIRWTGLAPWEFEFPFPGSLISTFLKHEGGHCVRGARGGFVLQVEVQLVMA